MVPCKSLPQGPVRFMGLLFLYNKDRNKERQAVQMTTRFKNVNGHIEVYSAQGEFLFSADTMEEAWRELCA